MKYLLEFEELLECMKHLGEDENANILDNVRHYKSNMAQYKKYWDNRMNQDSYPNKNTKYTIPDEREESDETYPYQTFGGLVPLTDKEKKNIEDNK